MQIVHCLFPVGSLGLFHYIFPSLLKFLGNEIFALIQNLMNWSPKKKIGTCHDSWAVISCGKFWSDINSGERCKDKQHLHKNLNWDWKIINEMAPGGNDYPLHFSDVIMGMMVLQITIFTIVISPPNEVGGGVYWIHLVRPSVCPSVRLSVDDMVSGA